MNIYVAVFVFQLIKSGLIKSGLIESGLIESGLIERGLIKSAVCACVQAMLLMLCKRRNQTCLFRVMEDTPGDS